MKQRSKPSNVHGRTEERQALCEQAGAYRGASIMTHVLGYLSQCVYVTTFVLLETSESLNQHMWYEVTCQLTLNYIFIDSPLVVDLGRTFYGTNKNRSVELKL